MGATGTRAKQRAGKGPMVAAAVKHFTERGYHGTSMRDIAGEAGVTVASIYHHFASKEEILRAIMVETMRDVLAQTREAVASVDDDPAAELGALVASWVRFHTDRQAEALIGASELRSLGGEGRAEVVALRDEQEQMFRDVIDRGVEAGVFRTPYPREAARAVINMGYSIASWYRPGGALTPAAMAERYSELALGTVRSEV